VSEPTNTNDAALEAFNYTAPTPVASNSNQAQQADIAAMIAAAVASALAQREAEQIAANQPKVLSPEEQARVHLDNRGYLLGVEERLQQLYHIVELIAQKVGI
jgi:hypothetical protein